MNNQFCMCGVQPGYPHKTDCPFPAYNARPELQDKWNKAREALIEECQTCGKYYFHDDGHWVGDPYGLRKYVCPDCEE